MFKLLFLFVLPSKQGKHGKHIEYQVGTDNLYSYSIFSNNYDGTIKYSYPLGGWKSEVVNP